MNHFFFLYTRCIFLRFVFVFSNQATAKANTEAKQVVITPLMEDEMEVDNSHMEELTKMETVKQKTQNTDEIEFDKIKVSDLAVGKRDEYRKIPVPRHRSTPLRQNWDSILKTLVEHMKLQVRMNTKRHAVELKVSQMPIPLPYERRGLL